MKPLAFIVEFTSDWHIGSGAGIHASVDRLVRRDADGLPFVPGKTLTGIWRQGCERAAWALDGGTHAAWHEWVEVLFGSEEQSRAAAVRIGSARLPESIRRRIMGAAPVDRAALVQATTLVRPGVRIEPATGRASAQQLRFIEMGRCGLSVHGNLSVEWAQWTPIQREAAMALLRAAAVLVEEIGGKRRRGAGRCTLTFVEKPDGWMEPLGRAAPEVPGVPEPEPLGPGKNIPDSSTEPGQWVEYAIDLTLLAPLVAPRRVVGNVVESLDYVPGTTLVPALLGAMRRSARDAGVEIDVDAAFRSGDVTVGNATPRVGGLSSLPAPRALASPKSSAAEETRPLRNRSQLSDPEDGEVWKVQRGGYVADCRGDNGATDVRYVSPHLQTTTHNSIDDAAQRPTETGGGVYTYEHLRAGLLLRSQLMVRASIARVLGDGWLATLGRETLGRSRKDEYGSVELRGMREQGARPSGVGGRPDVLEETTLVVWLLSDLLLRDARLRPTTSPDALLRELARALGVDCSRLALRGTRAAGEAADVSPGSAEPLDWIAGPGRRESWHTRWGLSRPSLLGLAAGSVAVVACEIPISAGRLRDVEAMGLGERRGEGFGRVSINHPLLIARELTLTCVEPDSSAAGTTVPALSAGDARTAEVIERAAWRAAIERGAGRVAAPQHDRGSGGAWPVGSDAPWGQIFSGGTTGPTIRDAAAARLREDLREEARHAIHGATVRRARGDRGNATQREPGS